MLRRFSRTDNRHEFWELGSVANVNGALIKELSIEQKRDECWLSGQLQKCKAVIDNKSFDPVRESNARISSKLGLWFIEKEIGQINSIY